MGIFSCLSQPEDTTASQGALQAQLEAAFKEIEQAKNKSRELQDQLQRKEKLLAERNEASLAVDEISRKNDDKSSEKQNSAASTEIEQLKKRLQEKTDALETLKFKTASSVVEQKSAAENPAQNIEDPSSNSSTFISARDEAKQEASELRMQLRAREAVSDAGMLAMQNNLDERVRELTESRQLYAEVQSSLLLQQQINAQLKENESQQTTLLHDLNAQLDDRQRELSDMKLSKDELQAEIEQQVQARESLEHSYAEVQKQLVQQQQLQMDLERAHAELQAQLQGSQESLAGIEQAHAELQAQVAQQNEIPFRLEEHNAALNKDLEQQKQMHMELSSTHASLQKQMSQLQREVVQAVVSQTHDVQQESQSSTHINTLPDSTSASMLTRVKGLEAENAELRSELEQLQLSIVEREEELLAWAETKLELEEGRLGSEGKSFQYSKENQDREASLKSAKDFIRASLTQSSIFNNLDGEVASLHEGSSPLPETVCAPSDARLRSQAGQKSSTPSNAVELMELHGTVEQLRASLLRMEGNQQALQADLNEARRELERSKTKEAALEVVVAELRLEVSQCRSLHEEDSRSTAALHREYNALKERHRAVLGEMKAKEEMLDLLQEQIHEMADFDVEQALADAKICMHKQAANSPEMQD
ncbi:hypothetical protein CEUSTIGMA_g11434.t1 [Chlamydomonas eustigma]|uniref:TATA element modulatory factor 1 TATA binding domain-containing protein n=1 Tax=Chlamydomonas eustigma TaxID=1157962 RepID=A0A250XM59_9CHLO|nr:hypothetical protein CEUSTIGMA_g11434.t1 [Chlamydomonas eustigma]|eukprot:GAX84009.1 hypothetical protein CEUSTIGMA_g11434.t1 [Chlamydomonas eustigma]